MKSPYKIAKELEVSPQSVYQKIERIQEQLNSHIQRNGKKILIDEEGEALLKSTFLNTVEQVIEQAVEQGIEQDLFNQLNKQLNTQNEYLRKQNELLMQELSKEREHSRQQAESLSELSEKLAELTKNGQILLLKQEQENTFLLSDEQAENKNKKSLWLKLFKGKKNKG